MGVGRVVAHLQRMACCDFKESDLRANGWMAGWLGNNPIKAAR